MVEQPARRDPAPPSRRRPVAINVQGATAKQLARAIFATAKPPDPSKRRPPRGRNG